MNDQEILDKIKQGDDSALEFLYKKNYRMMVKLILKNSGTEEEAKDIYQDALIVLWQKARSEDFILTSKISTFLYSVCYNLWRKELERKARHTSSEGFDRGEEMPMDEQEKSTLIQKCIHELGDTCKQVLLYCYYDKLSMTEIAEKMGFANADTAKTKKYKCKQELDKKIKSLYNSSDFLD
jgi:RNA polymerase sigma factor (sigma-70 family)